MPAGTAVPAADIRPPPPGRGPSWATSSAGKTHGVAFLHAPWGSIAVVVQAAVIDRIDSNTRRARESASTDAGRLPITYPANRPFLFPNGRPSARSAGFWCADFAFADDAFRSEERRVGKECR